MNKLSELITHMKKHKDAIIIVGPGINTCDIRYTVEEFNENYTRKNLKRDPEALWTFYMDKINCAESESSVYGMLKDIDHSLILDQNINGSIAAAYLHGHVNIVKCIKCKTIYPMHAIKMNGSIPEECECCGGQIRPSVLLSGERYDHALFNDFKEKLLDAHTVITIGMDYSEGSLLNLIADFGDMKSQLNAEGNPDNERVLVSIQEDSDFNPNDIAYHEFVVKGDIEDSMARFIKEYLK